MSATTKSRYGILPVVITRLPKKIQTHREILTVKQTIGVAYGFRYANVRGQINHIRVVQPTVLPMLHLARDSDTNQYHSVENITN